jgi:hypothetical protein
MNNTEIDIIDQAKKVADHIIEQINITKLYMYPYKHGICKNFLPEKFYNEIDQNFPHYNDSYNFYKCGTPGSSRIQLSFFNEEYKLSVHKIFTNVFVSFGNEITKTLFNLFNIKIPIEKTNWHCTYAWNFPDEQDCSKPHTDIKSKIISLVLYLPYKNQQTSGTDILTQIDNNNFKTVRTAAAIANNCLFFQKNDISWHRAKPTKSERRTITFFVTHQN